jgi:hypothetical protein
MVDIDLPGNELLGKSSQSKVPRAPAVNTIGLNCPSVLEMMVMVNDGDGEAAITTVLPCSCANLAGAVSSSLGYH